MVIRPISLFPHFLFLPFAFSDVIGGIDSAQIEVAFPSGIDVSPGPNCFPKKLLQMCVSLSPGLSRAQDTTGPPPQVPPRPGAGTTGGDGEASGRGRLLLALQRWHLSAS